MTRSENHKSKVKNYTSKSKSKAKVNTEDRAKPGRPKSNAKSSSKNLKTSSKKVKPESKTAGASKGKEPEKKRKTE